MYEMYRLHGDRQVRRALRHPEGPRRAGPRARGARLLARLRRGPGHVRVRPVRRGQRPAGRRWRSRPSTPSSSGRPPSATAPATTSCAAGSTCSTGTATAPQPGLFPPSAAEPARGRAVDEAPTRRPSRTPARRVVYQAASLVPRYPDERRSSSGCRCSGGPGRAADAGAARRSTALLDDLGTHAARPSCSARYVERLRPLAASTRSTCPTGPTATPAAAARCWARFKAALPAQRLPRRHRTASCPTTCRWCWSSRRCADPDAGRRAAAGRTGRASSCCGSRCSRDAAARTPACVAAVCATLPGASPADRAAVRRWSAAGPPTETVGLEPYDPTTRGSCRSQPVGGR